MERLRATTHIVDGEVVGEEVYIEVDKADDIVSLHKNVVSFVTRTEQANNNDVVRVISLNRGTLVGGSRFSKDGVTLKLSGGKRSASLQISPETQTATIIKTISPKRVV